MAITLDKVNIGTVVNDGPNSTSIAFTTTQIVAAGGLIVAGFGFDVSSATITAVSGGGLTWTILNKGSSLAAFDGCALAWALAPSGLVSGTTITGTISATCFGRTAGGLSFTGVDTGTVTDVQGTSQDAGAASAWASSSLNVQAGSLTCTVAWSESATSSTGTSGTEAFEANTGSGDGGIVVHYRIDAGGGTVTNAGTWNASARWVTASQAFLAAAGGGGGSSALPPRTFNAIPFMGGVL